MISVSMPDVEFDVTEGTALLEDAPVAGTPATVGLTVLAAVAVNDAVS